MKLLIIILLMLPLNSMAYDGVIRDNRGRIINYIIVDDKNEQIRILNARGYTTKTIEPQNNFKIENNRGYIEGDIDLEN